MKNDGKEIDSDPCCRWVGGVAAETSAAQIRRVQRGQFGQDGLLIETVLEDLLDRAIFRRAEVKRSRARGFEPTPPILVAQIDQPLGGTQMIETWFHLK